MKNRLLRKGWSMIMAAAMGLTMFSTPLTALAEEQLLSSALSAQQEGEAKTDPVASATNGSTANQPSADSNNAPQNMVAGKVDNHNHTNTPIRMTLPDGSEPGSVDFTPGQWSDSETYLSKKASPAVLARGTGQPYANNLQIDPSYLVDWITYDHYWRGTIDSTVVGGGGGLVPTTNAPGWGLAYLGPTTEPTGWSTVGGINEDGNHPFYYYQNAFFTSTDGTDYYNPGNKKASFYDLTYDRTNQAEKDRVYKEVLKVRDASNSGAWDGGKWNSSTPAANAFSQHIFSEGNRLNAKITFAGYGSGYYTDFALAPIDTHDLKSVGFDINCDDINYHTLNSFGFLINSGIKADKKLYGYALVFSNNAVYLVDITSGYDVDALHGVYANFNESKTEFLLVNAPIAGEGNSPLSAKKLGNINMSTGKLRVDMAIRDQEVTFQIGNYVGNNVVLSTDPALNGSQSVTLNNTNQTFFGPIVSYTGYGHYCDMLSWVSYDFLQMSVGYQAIFHGNYPGQAPGAVDEVVVYDNIPAVDALNNPATYSLDELSAAGKLTQPFPPPVPTHNGYAFVGWSTNKDTIGANREFEYSFLSKVNKITHIYAIWQPLGIEVINYTPPTWTNQNVVGRVKITSANMPTNAVVNVVKNGVTAQLTIGNIVQTGASEYEGTFTAMTNIPNGSKVSALVDNGAGGTQTVTNQAEITWIDKLKPLIDNMPANNGSTAGPAVTVKDATATLDNGMSGIATQKYTAVEAGGGTTYTSTVSWADLLGKMKTGMYTITVEATDNATNTEQKTATNVGHIKTGDQIKVTAVYAPATWTNKTVEATVTITSSLPLTTVTIGGAVVPSTNNGNGTYTVKHTFTQNEKKTLIANTANAAYKGQRDLEVTWIDRLKPLIDNMPANSGSTAGPAVTVKDATATLVDGESGIATQTYTAVEKDNMKYISTVSWADLLGKMKTGVYTITVEATDKATNAEKKVANNVAHVKQGDKVKLNVAYDPAVWTNKNVEATITITSVLKPTKVMVDGVDVTASMTGANGTYVVKNTFTQNATKAIVVETADSNYGATGTAKVTWIDKLDPLIKNMPADDSAITTIPVTVEDAAATAAYGKSEIATQEYTAEEAGGSVTYTSTISWADLLGKMKTGVYTITVEATDNATNKSTKKATNVSYVKQGDSIGVTITYNPNDWTNKTVEATIAVTSALPLTKLNVGTVDVLASATKVGNNYTAKYTFNANESKAVVAETADPTYNANVQAKVSWIDTVAPTFGNFPDLTAATSDGVLDATKVKTITFADTAVNANHNGNTESGVDNATKEIWLYVSENGTVSTTPIKIKWADLDTKWQTIPEGKYYYDIVAKDVATNQGKASDKGSLIGGGGNPNPTNPVTPGGPDPVDPTNPPVVVNPKGPKVVFTGITPAGWTNQNVTVSFKAESKADITNVTIKNANGVVVYTKNNAAGLGSVFTDSFVTAVNSNPFTITATDKVKKNATDTTAVTKIDKYKPLITPSATNGNLDDLTVTVVDDAQVKADNGVSGINAAKTLYTLKYLTATYTGKTLAEVKAKAPNYLSMTLSVSATDNAGNTNTKNIGTFVNGARVEPPKVQIISGDAILAKLTLNGSFSMMVTDASKTATWTVKQGNTVLKTSAQAGWSMTASPYTSVLKVSNLGITKAGKYTLTVSNSKGSVVKSLTVK